jgi:predicted nucleotidyltransferase
MQKKKSSGLIPAAITPIAEELTAHDAVIGIILFGSVARGSPRPFSDVDLCIVTRNPLSDTDRLELLSYGSEKIDVSIFSDLPVQIRFRVIKEGRVLFSKDSLALHRIKAATVREYLDIEPFIKRHCLHAITASEGS